MLLCYNHFIIHIVLTFPTKFFELGFAYSSVRAGRLALSSLPITDNEFFFGKYVLVQGFTKGILNLKPELQRQLMVFDSNWP